MPSGGRSPMDETEVLRALLVEYSPAGNEGRAVHRFVEAARALGYAAHIDRVGNAIARIGVGHPKVMFLGHIDTVPGALPVRVEGGRVQGRGACDAKGGLAASLMSCGPAYRPPGVLVTGALWWGTGSPCSGP